MPDITKNERLLVFFDILERSEPATNHDGAMALLQKLNDVEDILSGIEYSPDASTGGAATNGRLYPPHELFRYTPWERPSVRCYRQVRHATFVADNGAIEIRERVGNRLGEIKFEKQGINGRKVSDYDSSA